jgi:FemAB-related protein (PEP-CTERM system-associated)
MSVSVKLFTGTAEEWDRFVREQEGWTHFHQYGWRQIFERVFGHECLYLEARAIEGTLVGILPLVRVRSALFGHYLVSVPFLNYGGPLGSTAAVQALASWATERAREDGVKLLELRSRRELPLQLPVSHRKITVVLDLPAGDPDLLFKKFEAKLRSQVRKPQKEGVEVRFGPDQVGPFFQVFAEHMRDLGTPTQPRRLFETIAEVFPDAWFGCAWLGGKPVAGGAGFTWGREYEMTWASSLYAYNKVAPNMGLYWAFMQRAITEQLTLFNFGRCSVGVGTHRFKRQWGSRDEQLWWYQASPAGVEAGTPSPDDGAFSWGPRIWRKLPLPLATAMGPHIVRYIP